MVKDISGVNNLGWMYRLTRFKAGKNGSVDFAGADAVDQRAMATDQVENGKIRARFLRVADHIESGQVGTALGNLCCVVHVNWRAEFSRELWDLVTGNLID